MEPGGEPSPTCGGRTAPLRVRVERMDPPRIDSATWQDAVGPLLRLPRVGDLSRYLTAAYVVTRVESRESRVEVQDSGSQLSTLDSQLRIGYLTLFAGRRRNFVVIRSLWVEMHARRRGIGRRLVEELAADVRCEYGSGRRVKLLADVPERNLAAQMFFAAVGFRGRAGRGRKIRFAKKLSHG